MSKDEVAKAVLGQLPAALAETVSLATPLTMSRIEGRDEARPARDGPSPSGSASRSSPPTTTSGPSSRSSALARGARLVCSSPSPRARRAPIRRSTFTPGPGRS